MNEPTLSEITLEEQANMVERAAQERPAGGYAYDALRAAARALRSLQAKDQASADDAEWKIVSAAIRVRGAGKTLIFSLPVPARHNDVIRAMVAAGITAPVDHGRFEQGFLDSNGDFAWRTRARKIAIMAEQLLPCASKGDELFSEDVW